VVNDNRWANDKFSRTDEELMRSVVRVQDSVFLRVQAGYDLTMRCR